MLLATREEKSLLQGESRSLLTFLEAAVLVADPEGRAVYTNPAFTRAFEIQAEGVQGAPLTDLFEGGAREAVLTALARSCAESGRVRFFIRHGQVGYTATASPIESDGARVGVLLLFNEEVASEESLLAFHRKLEAAVDDITECFSGLRKAGGHHADASQQRFLEAGGRALDRLELLADELLQLSNATGQKNGAARGAVDAGNLVREAVATVADDAELARVHLELEVKGNLPPYLGNADQLSAAIVELLLDRFAQIPPKAWLTLRVKSSLRTSLSISLYEEYPQELLPDDGGELPHAVSAAITSLGGKIHVSANPLGGRQTTLSLPVGGPRRS